MRNYENHKDLATMLPCKNGADVPAAPKRGKDHASSHNMPRFPSHYFYFSRIFSGPRKKCARPSRLYTVALKYNTTQRIIPLILQLLQRYWISQLFKRSSSQRVIPPNQLQLFISPRNRVDTHHQDTLSCNTLAIHLHSSLKHKTRKRRVKQP